MLSMASLSRDSASLFSRSSTFRAAADSKRDGSLEKSLQSLPPRWKQRSSQKANGYRDAPRPEQGEQAHEGQQGQNAAEKNFEEHAKHGVCCRYVKTNSAI